MPTLQTFRQARTLARCVLAWFVLSLGLAVAAPIVQPESMALVCSASGNTKLLVGNGDGTAASASYTLDCVLCFVANAPPPASVDVVSLPTLRATVAQGASATRMAWRTAAPLSARGPPFPV